MWLSCDESAIESGEKWRSEQADKRSRVNLLYFVQIPEDAN